MSLRDAATLVVALAAAWGAASLLWNGGDRVNRAGANSVVGVGSPAVAPRAVCEAPVDLPSGVVRRAVFASDGGSRPSTMSATESPPSSGRSAREALEEQLRSVADPDACWQLLRAGFEARGSASEDLWIRALEVLPDRSSPALGGSLPQIAVDFLVARAGTRPDARSILERLLWEPGVRVTSDTRRRAAIGVLRATRGREVDLFRTRIGDDVDASIRALARETEWEPATGDSID